MFLRRIHVERVLADETTLPCPVAQIDNFCMRNFTNDAEFDDTLPIEDGMLEMGNQVSLIRLQENMEIWFRRKGYLAVQERLNISENHP